MYNCFKIFFIQIDGFFLPPHFIIYVIPNQFDSQLRSLTRPNTRQRTTYHLRCISDSFPMIDSDKFVIRKIFDEVKNSTFKYNT
jgi:hypothetical protein